MHRLLIVTVACGSFAWACEARPSHIDGSGNSASKLALAPPQRKHPTHISTPHSLRGLLTGETNAMGEPVVVACASCHAGRSTDAGFPEDITAVRGPHAGLAFAHGDNTCGACHDPEQRDKLRLADGTRIDLVDAMRLCSQCHGPQRRDYDHGAHGGMRGYWDLTRGPRERNHCVSCHDPHRPAYPKLIPAPPPRDRGMPIGGDHG